MLPIKKKYIQSGTVRNGKSWRVKVKKLETGEITETLCEDHFRSTMAIFGWITFQASRQLDNRKIDLICRYEHALIEVQLKSSNLKDEPYNNWSWDVFGDDTELDVRFYDQRHTFLCLVGINLSKDDPHHQKIVKDEYPQIALIPGREAIKYFVEHDTKSLSISVGPLKNKSHDLSKYFGEENIYKILMKDQKEQENENKILDRIEKKGNKPKISPL